MKPNTHVASFRSAKSTVTIYCTAELFHMLYNNIIARIAWELESTVHGVG